MRRPAWFALATAAALTGAASSAHAQTVIEIPIGYARPISAPAEVETIVVGDPAVIEATIGGNKLVTISAKKVGQTNFMMFDGQNNMLFSADIAVVNQDRRQEFSIRLLTGGGGEEFYLCGPGPGCSPRGRRAVPQPPTPTTNNFFIFDGLGAALGQGSAGAGGQGAGGPSPSAAASPQGPVGRP
ncbi:MAG TPA: pilus assembly protein N-terminal domain-containing protein [Microvirga sp.]|jgi:hypothetical protein|nr:pilus assembly protein N-terminal domain-containing protein [Microvirga sp.]